MARTPGTSFSSISLHKFILLFDASILTAVPLPALPHVALHPANSKSLLFCLFSTSSVHLFPNCAVSLLLTHSATQFARPLFPQPFTLLSLFLRSSPFPFPLSFFSAQTLGAKTGPGAGGEKACGELCGALPLHRDSQSGWGEGGRRGDRMPARPGRRRATRHVPAVTGRL